VVSGGGPSMDPHSRASIRVDFPLIAGFHTWQPTNQYTSEFSINCTSSAPTTAAAAVTKTLPRYAIRIGVALSGSHQPVCIAFASCVWLLCAIRVSQTPSKSLPKDTASLYLEALHIPPLHYQFAGGAFHIDGSGSAPIVEREAQRLLRLHREKN
jgi:hypothetical protein